MGLLLIVVMKNRLLSLLVRLIGFMILYAIGVVWCGATGGSGNRI